MYSCYTPSSAAMPPTAQQVEPLVQALRAAAEEYEAAAEQAATSNGCPEHHLLLAPYCNEQSRLFHAAAGIVQALLVNDVPRRVS
jgi:hypothetical protein